MKKFIWLISLIFAVAILTFAIIGVTGDSTVSLLKKGYQLLSGKKPQHIALDANGVPFVIYESGLGQQRNPVTVAETALKYFAVGSESSNASFLHCVQWLDSASVLINDTSIIYYNRFPWSHYQLASPWRSAMSQGRIAQVYMRAFQLSADSQYLVKARKTINTLFIEVKDGGVTYKDSTGWWYEEYAGDNVKESRVLNGMIIVLLGLHEFYHYTGDTVVNFLFQRGVQSVAAELPGYNNKGHSNYDLLGQPASQWYHQFHISLLDSLYTITGNEVFATYRDAWKAYRAPGFLKRFIEKPNKIGAAAILFTLLIVSVPLFLVFRRFRKQI